MIYSTPTNQFPLGVMLPLARRLALLDYACQNNTWIVEDDSDGDFSYCGRLFRVSKARITRTECCTSEQRGNLSSPPLKSATWWFRSR